MEFQTVRARARRQVKLAGDRRAELYPHRLQFYELPPLDNISLQEFEDFAVDRLKVLKAVENVGIKHIRGTDAYTETLRNELKKQGVQRFLQKPSSKDISNEEYDDRRKDHISHFILRLAYCRSEELRRWFIQQELEWFRFKFHLEDKDSIKMFLELNNLDYTPIPALHKRNIMPKLLECSRENRSIKIDQENYYKVPFVDVLDLVRTRKVYLENGMAFVPHSELIVIILHHYRSHLSHALAVTSRALPHLEEDGRLLPMLSGLSKRYLGTDYASKKPKTGQITADMVNGVAKKNFPLCMLNLHQSLRQHHHLRHGGRMQYGLFLKGIGLSLEEALKFWRAEFSKVMDPDKFDKQYAYTIRHNYGKEGKRTDYTPQSCMKIIMSNMPGAGDYHGCPFKHTDVDILRQKLQGLLGSKKAIDDISSLVKGGHFQLACGKYFESQHGEGSGFSPNHPNKYFDETMKTPVTPSEGSSQTPGSVKLVKAVQKRPATNDGFDDLPMSVEAIDEMFNEESQPTS